MRVQEYDDMIAEIEAVAFKHGLKIEHSSAGLADPVHATIILGPNDYPCSVIDFDKKSEETHLTTCTCWEDYPNPSLGRANGNWICKDAYRCIRQRTGMSRYSGYKTKCVKIKRDDGTTIGSCENCATPDSEHCELGNKKKYGFCGNWQMKESEATDGKTTD